MDWTFFDRPTQRRGTHSLKWDSMEARTGVAAANGLPMWVADMDFPAPPSVQEVLGRYAEHGIYGYFGDDREYRAAIVWWMREQHGWSIQPEWIFTTHGLVNGTALCIQTWSQPGNGVVLLTPVYHMFAQVIRASGRRVVECPLVIDAEGRYALDIAAWDDQLDGSERMLILCSPHNPGGRVWTPDELAALAEWARRHDWVVVSDEIHHDLVLPGHRHYVLDPLCPDLRPRLVTLTSASKTFNLAGGHTGNVIIADAELRTAFTRTLDALGIGPNAFGLHLATAAYSRQGRAWLDALIPYLARNIEAFAAGVNAIEGLRVMPQQATYLAWVDFSASQLPMTECLRRVEQVAAIAVNRGTPFGLGGESSLRFNLATQHDRVLEAVKRMQDAFAAD